ncbi:MAG: ABC transporter permease [Candidatus Abyssobacteria bacterium SURF_5]|uniref:ABC transporter permease n=1 Tax=Abyssobacteria bacterium (strain SURF_5) TaxID=2093360 RepID=A0A3A4N972_ABYX5|nr:MAG: ABC transporter permease [Candidatus Abyssubacteria bacterium SURF_5]
MNGQFTSFLSRRIISFRRIRVMTVKELLQLLRDTVLMGFIVYAFLGDVYLAGSGVKLQLTQAATVVNDADHSFASRDLIQRFQLPYFRLDGQVKNGREGVDLMDRGKAMVVIDIPPQFEQSLLKGEPTSVQMHVDTTNSVPGLLAGSYAMQIVAQYGLETSWKRLGYTIDGPPTGPMVLNKHRVWFNPNQNETWFMSILELSNVITVLAILLPGAAMVREKERGTIEQLLVSPLTPFEIMVPKVLAMSVMILLGTALSILLILEPVFHIPIEGSLFLFFAVTSLYVFTLAGFGLFAATIGRNLAEVGMLTILIVLPMIFPGAWTPPEAMPKWMLILTLLSPLHYYTDVSYGIFLKGAGLGILWDSVVCIILLGGAVFGFGLWRFRRQFG